MSHYTHLTIEERESILRMLAEKKGIREIARELQRSASTISREICRNQERSSEYSSSKAEAAYHKRRQRCGRQRIFKVNLEAKRKVRHLFLDLHWSPEQISCRLRMEGNEVQVSYTTIYRGIYSHDLEEAKLSHGCRGMVRLLRHHGKTRHKKGTEERRGKIAISHPIEDRPDEANTRKEIGHWEADTVAGKTGKSCMITLADRKSRFLIGKKVSQKAASEVEDGMVAILLSLPPDRRRSVTPDRGKEFANHASITEATGTSFYFPKPHAPWERGTNENTNGLLREFFPKGADLDPIPDSLFDSQIDLLNHRPRKCLGWKSPFEVFFGTSLHLT